MTARLSLAAIAASSALLFNTMPASAASGDIDTSFGNNGWVETVVLPDTIAPVDEAQAVAQQADGKLVVVGQTQNDGNQDAVITRYNTDGSIDTSFGSNGVVIQPIGNSHDQARGVVVQDDGKLVVAGITNNASTSYDIFVARYLSDGSLDTSFGSNGVVVTALSSSGDYAESLLLQPDGKLVVAGYTNGTGMLVRYNSDGSLDTSFNGSGIATGTSGFSFIGMALQTDGKLVATGSFSNGSDNDFAVTRFNSDGSVDSGFGTNGTVLTDLGGNDIGRSVIVQADSKLVVVGYFFAGAAPNIAVARYNSNGTLDSSFDADGMLTLAVGPSASYGWDVLQDAGGKLVIAAESFIASGTMFDFTLVRLNDDGSLDTSYNTDGIATGAIDAAAYSDRPRRILQQPDGKLVVVGSSFTSISTNTTDFSVARFNTDGSLDSSFAGDGTLRQQFGTPSSNAYLNGLALQPDGKIIAGGYAISTNSNQDPVLVRYDGNGTLDTGFASNGIAQAGLVGGQQIYATLRQDDGKVVSAGMSISGTQDFLLLRHNSDGSIDTSFGSSGQVLTDLGTNLQDTALAAIQQTDGKLVAAGRSYNSSLGYQVSSLARYNSDGSLDTSFSGDGRLTIDVSGGNNWLNAVAQQADGKLLAVGQAYDGNTTRISLVRFNSDGTLDNSFGNAGISLATPGGSSAVGVDLVIQSDGRIVVALYAGGNLALMRFNSDGTPDTGFGNAGVFQQRVGSQSNTAFSMVEQDDGKLLLLGRAYSANGVAQAVLLRFTADGSLDPYFGDSGIQTLDREFTYPTSLTVQDDGNILVGGYNAAPATFLVTRVIGNSPDADADGVPDDVDAFPNNSDASVDNDNDGLPDSWNASCDATCQESSSLTLDLFLDDSDNDGVTNNNDAFPNDPGESADSDGDGVGDNADAFPGNSDASVDNDNDGLPDSWNASCDATCQGSSSLTLDTLPGDSDNDGIPDASDNVVGDDNPPQVIAPMDISLAATGDTTEVVLGVATATDVTDGTLSALPDTDGNATTVNLAPGRHVITWSATDNAGNTGSDTQVVEITPLARFSASAQTVGEGSLVTITVTLNGDALAYPVVIPLELDATSTATNPADHDGASNTIVIQETADPANTGRYQFVAGDDGLTGEADETVIFNIVADNGIDTLSNAAIDINAGQHVVTLTELNVAPVITGVTLSDGTRSTVFDGSEVEAHKVIRRNRQITLAAELTDANPEDSHSYSWMINDALQAETGATLTLDLLDYELGEYSVSVQALDNGNPPEYSNTLAADITLVPPPKKDSGGGSLHWIWLLAGVLVARRKAA